MLKVGQKVFHVIRETADIVEVLEAEVIFAFINLTEKQKTLQYDVLNIGRVGSVTMNAYNLYETMEEAETNKHLAVKYPERTQVRYITGDEDWDLLKLPKFSLGQVVDCEKSPKCTVEGVLILHGKAGGLNIRYNVMNEERTMWHFMEDDLTLSEN